MVCVWNQVSMREIQMGGRRCRLSSAVSQDDGRTWGHFKTIEVGGVDRNVTWVRAAIEPAFVRSFDEVGDMPEDWGMFGYANLNFAHEKAFLEYDYRVGATAKKGSNDQWGMAWKTSARQRRILPIDWFYLD